MSRELTRIAHADADADAEADCMQFNCSPIDFALGQSVACLALQQLLNRVSFLPLAQPESEGCKPFDRHSKCHQMVC